MGVLACYGEREGDRDQEKRKKKKERKKQPIMNSEQQEIEVAKRRCSSVMERIQRLPRRTNITDWSRRTLLKLAHSELNFLSRLSSSSAAAAALPHRNLSVNIGHLEAVVHLLQQHFVTGVSRICKPIPLSNGCQKDESRSKSVHVDIVCTVNKHPVWIVVSDRNPKYVSWHGCRRDKGLKLRVEQLLAAVQSSQVMKPHSIILFFSHGLSEFVRERLRDEFAAVEFSLEFQCLDFDFCDELEGEWVNVLARSYREACVLEIKVDSSGNAVLGSKCDVEGSLIHEKQEELARQLDSDNAFLSLISRIKLWPRNNERMDFSKYEDLIRDGDDLVNFDTTALIALVSGISNGCTEKLLAVPEIELRQRFKGNFEFVIAQVMSEIQNPMLAELAGIVDRKRGIVCESVFSEFKELVSLCGGSNEKLRANKILKCLMVVPDSPSERMMGLPTTRKLALKNKIVFGTGDCWHAPTLTANMAFVRAVSQTGMSLFTIEHRPRALTGD